jgi:hypothetical protein
VHLSRDVVSVNPHQVDERDRLLAAAQQVLGRTGWSGFEVEGELRQAGLSTRSDERADVAVDAFGVPGNRGRNTSQLHQRFAEMTFDLEDMGVTAGTAPARADALLFSRSSTIAAGTTEVMKTILAEHVLGLPR